MKQIRMGVTWNVANRPAWFLIFLLRRIFQYALKIIMADFTGTLFVKIPDYWAKYQLQNRWSCHDGQI